jgi:hypothetical protein
VTESSQAVSRKKKEVMNERTGGKARHEKQSRMSAGDEGEFLPTAIHRDCLTDSHRFATALGRPVLFQTTVVEVEVTPAIPPPLGNASGPLLHR